LPASSGRTALNEDLISDPQRANHRPRSHDPGVLLLAGDEVAISHSVRFEASVDDEVGGSDAASFVFDPERLNATTDEIVGELLFRVGEAGPGLALYQEPAVGGSGGEPVST
jgi:hypothetical protein